MTFKEQIAADNRVVFMNTLEFADAHNVNGVNMPCVIDDNEMIEREKRFVNSAVYGDGVYVKQMLIYVRAEDFGALPAVGRRLVLDGRGFIITDSINEGGIYSISLESCRS